ncbi:hypothetical protein AB0M95_01915 [Sphaerisporangium sp. NPDC051017]|uniref:hypothetical protein n=1 Tax=Sphaerisporangium sp. NPDC051017 TaxID=3154636 RepID=UPI00344A7F02
MTTVPTPSEATTPATDILTLNDDQLDGVACIRCGATDTTMVPAGHGERGQLFECSSHAADVDPETAFQIGFAAGVRFTADNPGDQTQRADALFDRHLTEGEQAALARAYTNIIARRSFRDDAPDEVYAEPGPADALAKLNPADLVGVRLVITGRELLTLASSVSAVRPAIREGDAGFLLDVLEDAHSTLAAVAERYLRASIAARQAKGS